MLKNQEKAFNKKYNINSRSCLWLKGTTIAVDCETTGLDPYKSANRPFMLSYVTDKNESGIIYKDDELMEKFLQKIFYKKNNNIVGHNIKFDMGMFREAGFIDLKKIYLSGAAIHCTMVQSKLIYNLGYHNLAYLAKKYLKINTNSKDACKEWLQQNSLSFKKEYGRKPNYSDIPQSVIIPYALNDVIWCLKLHYYFFTPRKDKDFQKLYKIDIAQIFIALDMESEGVVVDLKRTKKLYSQAVKDLSVLNILIVNGLGANRDLNINSGKQLIKEFFVKKQKDTGRPLYIPQDRTKKGAPSVSGPAILKLFKNKDSLEYAFDYSAKNITLKKYIQICTQYEKSDFILLMLLKYKELKKFVSTYYFNILEKADPDLKDQSIGKLHCQFNPFLAVTGRYSSGSGKKLDDSSGLNLQNIPSMGSVRECIIPKKNYINAHIDYSQIELRLGAHYSGDENMIQDFIDGKDLHMRTATNVYSKPADQILKKERKIAKTLNFGIWYGIGSKALSATLFNKVGLEVSVGEAAKFIAKYYKSFPLIGQLMSSSQGHIMSKGYIEDEFKRKYFCSEAEAYKATNYLIQGCAAIIMKKAMYKCYDYILMNNIDAKIIMTIHDEVVFQIPKKCMKKYLKIFKSIMEDFTQFRVPIKVDVEVYDHNSNWAEKTKYELLK